MIRIERKDTAQTQLAIKDLEEASQRGNSYNTENVNRALKAVFYGKCYICENKHATSYQIEHLIPHHGNARLKYDWNNLFWACAHCNNIKSDKYEPILDCTKRSLEFTPLVSDDEEVERTVSLLEDVYYGTTPQKKIEAQIIRKNLRKNLSKFKEYVREYQEAEDVVEKDDIGELLKRELNNSSEFTAFKRWLIWDNEMFSEIEKYIPKKD